MNTASFDGEVKYPHIFAPRKIGTFTAPNSVKYAACSVSNFNHEDGSISEREMARMQTICNTGAGLITNQGAYPDPEGFGKAYYRQLSIAEDRFIPGFAKIADMIHDRGALAVQQVLHAGRYGGIDGDRCLQPSEVQQTLPHFRPPRRMTKDDIRKCIHDHVQASRRAMEAGFDGVEITAFMGYLLANFLSPFTNDRSDEYGGSFENRGRFMVELIDEIKTLIGDGMFWIRLNATELMDDRGGTSEEECLEFMKLAERSGADGISIVIGWHESTRGALGRDLPTDQWLYLAERARAQLSIPIAFGPRFGDPVLADRSIGEGKLDFWEVCRPFLADPELLIKVREDRLEDIRPCIGGLMCLSRMFRNLPYVCSMNPMLGHEYEPEYHIVPTRHPKRVTIIGAGPAGLEAAVTAARKGHRVTLFDQASQIGGQLRSASTEIAGGHVFTQLLQYYQVQLEKLGVELQLGKRVEWRQLAKHRPDVGIVACGASIQGPDLPGLETANVIQATEFTGPEAYRNQSVVVIGAERAALVVAERLAEDGNRVVIVDQGQKLAGDVIPTFRWRHIAWLRELQIEVLKHTSAAEVTESGLLVRDKDGEARTLPFDLLVIGGPRKTENALSTELLFSCDELYTVGDAIAPRNVCDAVHEGYKIGVRI